MADRRRPRRIWAIRLPAVLAFLAFLACGVPEEPASPPSAGRTAPPPALTVGPIRYFEDHCARCHGPEGSFYGPEFVNNLQDEDELRHLVEEMAAGPGGRPLEGADLEAQVAYHQHIASEMPFIAVTGRDEDTWTGEVTTGATLELHVNNQARPLDAPGGQWRLDGADLRALLDSGGELAARKTGRETRLDPAHDNFTRDP